ncbi:MAG: NAD(+) synthase [Polyangiaceae bacterium]
MFSKEILAIDAAAVTEKIAATLREQVMGTLKKRGLVVGISGGIDSSVVAALAARAFGKERVFAIMMPERDSSSDSSRLGRVVAESLGIQAITEELGPTLEAAGCYARQLEAIRTVVPEYGDGWKCKLSLPSILDSDRINVTYLTVASPTGESKTVRLPPAAYLQIVAATNYKQRLRKVTEYYHADRLNYAVSGTPNRLEYDQGFFVKGGDGLADVKPIAHLYKTQVYALAAYLGVPEEIQQRPPTTDTFSLPQGQDEFYFSLPYHAMDLALYGKNHDVPVEEVARVLDLNIDQAKRVFKDIEQKRRATRYLHTRPLLVEPVREVEVDAHAAASST